MASPLDLLRQTAAGQNVCAPAVTPVAAAPTPVIVQNNPIGCYSGCAIPPTPPSVPIQANLGQKCGDLNICVKNTTSATPLTLVIGGGANSLNGFAEDNNPADTLTVFTEVTFSNTPVNASPAATSCVNGIVSANNHNAPQVRFLNSVFALEPVILTGFVMRSRAINPDGDDNTGVQNQNSITVWEVDPFDGKVIDICTRSMDVAVCSPCVGDSNVNPPVTFQEDCATYVGPDNGFSLQIEPNTQVTLQACYIGIADIRDYRDCSLPTWSPMGAGVSAAY